MGLVELGGMNCAHPDKVGRAWRACERIAGCSFRMNFEAARM